MIGKRGLIAAAAHFLQSWRSRLVRKGLVCLDDYIQSTFEAVDKLRDLTSEAPNAHGLFCFSEGFVLCDHRTVGVHKMVYDLTLWHAFPLQSTDSRIELADVGHGIDVGKQPLDLLKSCGSAGPEGAGALEAFGSGA
jgi:hypothetical protein